MFDRLKKKMGLGRQTYPVHFAAMPQTAEVHEPDHRPLPDFARRGPGVRIVQTPMDAFSPLPPIRPLSPMRASMMIPPQVPLPPIPSSPKPRTLTPVPAPLGRDLAMSPTAPARPKRRRAKSAAKPPNLSLVMEGDETVWPEPPPRPALRVNVDAKTLQNAALVYASQVLAQMASPQDSGYGSHSPTSDTSEQDSFYYDQFDFGFDQQRPESGFVDPSLVRAPSFRKRPRLPKDRIGYAK